MTSAKEKVTTRAGAWQKSEAIWYDSRWSMIERLLKRRSFPSADSFPNISHSRLDHILLGLFGRASNLKTPLVRFNEHGMKYPKE